MIIDEDRVLSTGNFHTPSLALAFETLGPRHRASGAGECCTLHPTDRLGRNGLPRYLSPVGGASAGFVPLQKTVTALVGAIRHKANPVLLDFLAGFGGVEDHATQTPLAVAKCAEIIDLWRQLVACEMLAAAQAIDLKPGLRCGKGTTANLWFRSGVSPKLEEDRALGADVLALVDSLRQ